jgi:hypothetical protein
VFSALGVVFFGQDEQDLQDDLDAAILFILFILSGLGSSNFGETL